MKRSALLFGFLFFSTFTSHAAPFPRGLPSSQMEPQIGLYQNQEVGFRLESKGTDWTLGEAPKSAAGIEALYYAPEKSGDSRGLLTVRVDKNVEAADLKTYMDKWNQEYPRYGFNVLGSRTFDLDGQQGYVVDLVNKEKNRQMRQVVYYKDKNAVILTCRDDLSEFEASLRSCNTIMKSFAWNQKAAE